MTDRPLPRMTVTGPSRDPFGADMQHCAPLTVAEARAVLVQLPADRCRGELASARAKIQRVADEGERRTGASRGDAAPTVSPATSGTVLATARARASPRTR